MEHWKDLLLKNATSYPCKSRKTPVPPSLLLMFTPRWGHTKFYSIDGNYFYNENDMGNPYEVGILYFCTRYSWVICVDEYMEAFLFNPLTRAEIPLPPVTTISPRGKICLLSSGPTEFEKQSSTLYEKYALSSSPIDPDCMVVLRSSWNTLVIGHPGGVSWRKLPDNRLVYGYHDVIFHKGCICAVTCYGEISVWNNPSDMEVKPITIFSKLRKYTKGYLYHNYLVVTPSGDLLVLCRRDYGKDLPEDQIEKSDVLIFNVDLKRKKMKEMKSLGNYSIFLDCRGSICLSSSDVPSMKPNRIYFTHENWNGTSITGRHSDISVYSLEKRCLEGILCNADFGDMSAPTWFIPSFW